MCQLMFDSDKNRVRKESHREEVKGVLSQQVTAKGVVIYWGLGSRKQVTGAGKEGSSSNALRKVCQSRCWGCREGERGECTCAAGGTCVVPKEMDLAKFTGGLQDNEGKRKTPTQARPELGQAKEGTALIFFFFCKGIRIFLPQEP